MPFDLAPILEWITANPHFAGLAIFLIACAESLAVVGLFLPGAVLMFGVGALVGSGALELTPVLIWAAFGAIAGDGISFWLGWRYRERLLTVWPFSTHPQIVETSTRFFHRHGGKSVLLGRFVGPIRPVIPAVAGMLGMPPGRFLAVNVISGVLWAPVYVIPGAIFTATLGLAAEVATRLAFLAGLLLMLLVGVVWGVRRLFDLLHPRAHGLIVRVLDWSRLHPLLGRLPAALLDPDHPETRGLTLLALLLLLAALLFLALLENVAGGPLLRNLDAYLHYGLQGLRSPATDRLLVAASTLSDPWVLAALALAVTAWLAAHRRWRAAAHWLGAVAFALVITHLLHLTGLGLRPSPIEQAARPLGFPSGTTVGSVLVYGFLGVLLARETADRRRWLIYAAAAALITLVAFARLYLGALWLSDVLGGLTLGLIWVALLGIAYRRHPAAALPARGLAAAALATLLIAGLFRGYTQFSEELTRYRPRHGVASASAGQWWEEGWGRLPAFRQDLRERENQPLTVQYAGRLEALESQLAEAGWRRPLELSATSWLRWLATAGKAEELPVLPQLHDGRYEALRLIKPLPGGQQLLVLRLWPAHLRLTPGEVPLWVGNAGLLTVRHPWGMASLPLAEEEFAAPLAELRRDLGAITVEERLRICRPVACPLLTLRADELPARQ